jgi:hypothetical protein
VPADRLVLQGRFKLLRHLGGGGMSEVYLAEQVSLGRPVALKVLKRDLGAQPTMRDRFRREAQLLSTVAHPAVVRVIDFETNPTDGTVLVLEYAEGETFEQALRPGPFEPMRAVKVLLQLAEGLAAIHDKGIIHRDIKPQNVVLSQTQRGEQARLLDFGIARLMELADDAGAGTPGAGSDPQLSHPGQAIGTPAYVAPEQAMAKPVSPATDVYSFGVLAFRLLAGRLPFEGPDTRAYLEQHVAAKPPRLDEVAPALASFPPLVKLVMACLEKKAEARPADGHALVDALKACLPASQVPLTTQTRQVLSAVTTQTLSAVQGGVETLGERGRAGALQVRRLARRLDAPTRRALAITLAVTCLVPTAWALWPRSVAERAAQLLEQGRPGDALALVDAALPEAKGELPQLLPLKVAALHQLGRAQDERALLDARPYQAVFTAPRALLVALAEDLCDAEGDADLREVVALVPARDLVPVFRELAAGVPSRAQWGALRWLDREGGAGGVDVATRYAASLKSKQCELRAQAAVRLGELGDLDAIGPLRELSETPKDEARTGPVNCGQDEAAEAIRRLKKK